MLRWVRMGYLILGTLVRLNRGQALVKHDGRNRLPECEISLGILVYWLGLQLYLLLKHISFDEYLLFLEMAHPATVDLSDLSLPCFGSGVLVRAPLHWAFVSKMRDSFFGVGVRELMVPSTV